MKGESARLHAFQTLLDGSVTATEPTVEMSTLRKLCARGIPAHPPHLRPLAWSLLLEVLPAEKIQWKRANKTHRERYYALVRALMDELSELDIPSEQPTASDSLLTQLSRDLERSFSSSPFFKSRTTPSRTSPLAPPRDSSADVSSSDSDSETQDTSESSSAILNRRAAFRRLEMISEAEHRRAHAPSVDRKGKGRALEPAIDLEIQSTQKSLKATHLTLEPILSPRITLSTSESGASTHPYSAPLTTPQLSLSIPSAESSPSATTNKASSPITLLSPRPIPASKLPLQPDSPALPGSLLQPDTHAESILRILYVFVKAHPQWEYTQGFADVLIPLYRVYALGGDGESDTRQRPSKGAKRRLLQAARTDALPAIVQDAPRGRYAEEETFWAFAALMGELGGVVAGPPRGLSWDDGSEGDGVKAALEKLGRRVRWADEELWTGLKQRSLDPATPFYTYRFVALLLSRDLPLHSLLRTWDYMLSQSATTPTSNAKLDAVVDVCTAMLLLVKDELLKTVHKATHRKAASASGLWGAPEFEPEEALSHALDLKNPDALGEAFAYGMKILQSYPLPAVGGIEAVLDVTFKLQQEKMLVGDTKDSPDSAAWIAAKDAADSKVSWSSAASLATSKLWASTVSPGAPVVTGPSVFSKYASAFQHSDAAASVAKASQGWGATAMAKWKAVPAVTAAVPSLTPSASTWGSLGSAAGRFLGTGSPVQTIPEPPEDSYTAMHTSPPTRRGRDEVEIESPQTARGGMSGSPSYLDSLSSTSRHHRSDSTSSSRSALSLQDRLAGLTTSVAPAALQTLPSAGASPSGSKPLLLSGSARRASGLMATPPNLGRVGARVSLAGQDSPSSRAALTPPASSGLATESETQTRTVPIGRRRHVTPASKRSSMDETPSQTSGRSITAAANRLRDATSVNDPQSHFLPRSPRQAGLSEKVGKVRLAGRRPLDRARPMSSSSVDSWTSPSTPGSISSQNEDDTVRVAPVKKYTLTDAAVSIAMTDDDFSTDETDMAWIANGIHASVSRSHWQGAVSAVKYVQIESEMSMKPHNIVREIRILERVSHPNIIHLWHVTKTLRPPGFRLYLPFCPVSLASIINHPTLMKPTVPSRASPSTQDWHAFTTSAASFSVQLLLSLCHLHSLNPPVAHRDIKPDNIMIDADGTLKLIDFATAWDEGHAEVDNDETVCQVGTGPYRAPELLFGPHRYDAVALDLWSAGATMAELYTPFCLCVPCTSRAVNIDLLSQNDEPLSELLTYESDSSEGSSGPASAHLSSVDRAWSRQTLFRSDAGDLGLVWSIFRICGTPNAETWQSFHALPDAGKIQYAETPCVPLQRLLPFADDAICKTLSTLLSLEPRSRPSAADVLRQQMAPVILPSSLFQNGLWYGDASPVMQALARSFEADHKGLLRRIVHDAGAR